MGRTYSHYDPWTRRSLLDGSGQCVIDSDIGSRDEQNRLVALDQRLERVRDHPRLPGAWRPPDQLQTWPYARRPSTLLVCVELRRPANRTRRLTRLARTNPTCQFVVR